MTMDLSLKPISERPSLAPYLRPDGQYDITALHAGLFTLDQDGELSASQFVQGASTEIVLMLFMADYPVIQEAAAVWDAVEFVESNGGNLPVPGYHLLPGMHSVGDAGGVIGARLGAFADVDAGELVSGTTLTNAVQVEGYLSQINFPDYSIQVDSSDVDAEMSCLAISAGAVINGPIGSGNALAYNGANSTGGPAGAAFPNVASVILDESDYTAAIRAANNVFTTPAGVVVHVVGIHEIPPVIL
jgi:hypothetical protein